MYTGQTIRFRYEGGSYPGMRRTVQIENYGSTFVEGFDLSLANRPYRRFRRNLMTDIVEVNQNATVA